MGGCLPVMAPGFSQCKYEYSISTSTHIFPFWEHGTPINSRTSKTYRDVIRTRTREAEMRVEFWEYDQKEHLSAGHQHSFIR